MRKFRKENLQHVNTGNPLSRAPEMKKRNVFSRPITQENAILADFSEGPMIGELNLELENMKI